MLMALEDVVARPGIRTRDSDDIADGVDNRVKNQCIEYRKAAEPVRGWLNAQPLGIEPGTASACVTTKTFLEAFGFASLRYLPDLERLKAEKLLRGGQGEMIWITRSGCRRNTSCLRTGSGRTRERKLLSASSC
ncbi:MAG: hypothetical protein JO136_24520 [Hyphomicrobiales bacterium]|nr:hypothetical protein [Hyphomicrobiales bacterium]